MKKKKKPDSIDAMTPEQREAYLAMLMAFTIKSLNFGLSEVVKGLAKKYGVNLKIPVVVLAGESEKVFGVCSRCGEVNRLEHPVFTQDDLYNDQLMPVCTPCFVEVYGDEALEPDFVPQPYRVTIGRKSEELAITFK